MSQTKAQLIDPVDLSIVTADLADDAVTAAKLASNAVVNASVDASAAIAGSKISPSFTSALITNAATGSAASANQAVFDYNTSDTRILSYNSSGSSINLFTNPNGGSLTSRLTITSSGNVGIGATSPAANLHLKDGSGNTEIKLQGGASTANDVIAFLNSAGSTRGNITYDTDNDFVLFNVNTSERMRIDSSGRVGINQTTFATSDTMLSISELTGHLEVGLISKNDSACVLNFGDPENYNIGRLKYANDDNSMRFDVNASERIRIDSSGRVGIGQSSNLGSYDSSAERLVVGDGSADEGITIVSGQAVGHHGSIFFADGTGSTNSKRGQIRYEQNTEAMKFVTAGSERLRIDINGNVGIGTTSPVSDIHTVSSSDHIITHQSTTSGADIRMNFRDSGNTDQGGVHYLFNGNSLKFITATSERMRIDSSGNVNIGVNTSANPFTKLIFGASQFGSAEIRPTNEASHKIGLSFYTDGTNDSLNPVERMRIDSSGKVGIGTTSPSEALHVTGGHGAGILISSAGTTSGGVLNLQNEQGSNQKFSLAVGGGDNAYVQGRGLLLRDETNSANRVVLLTNGNVGIGTQNPAANLHVHTDANGEGILIKSTGNTSNALTFDANRGADGVIGVMYGRWNGTTVAQMSFISGSDGTNKDDGIITFGTESAASNGNVNAAEKIRIDSFGNFLVNTTSKITDTKAVIDGNLTLRNASTGSNSIVKTCVLSKAYSMSTSTVNVLTFDAYGNGCADITCFRKDTGSPQGGAIHKIYLGFKGSGSNMSDVSIAQENKVNEGNIHGVTFSAAASNNDVILKVTGDDNGGEGQELVFFIQIHGKTDGSITVN